jgi:hypothetical protein
MELKQSGPALCKCEDANHTRPTKRSGRPVEPAPKSGQTGRRLAMSALCQSRPNAPQQQPYHSITSSAWGDARRHITAAVVDDTAARMSAAEGRRYLHRRGCPVRQGGAKRTRLLERPATTAPIDQGSERRAQPRQLRLRSRMTPAIANSDQTRVHMNPKRMCQSE